MAQAGNPRAQTQTAIAQPQVGMSQLGQAAGNFGSSMLGGGQTQTQVQMPQPQQAQVQMPQPQQAQVQMPQPQQAQVQMPQPQQAQGQGGKGGAATGAPQQAQQPNVYQQSAQGLTDAMAGARAGMQYQPMNVQAAYYNPSTMQGVGNIGMQNVYGQGYNAAQVSGAAPIRSQNVSGQGYDAAQVSGASPITAQQVSSNQLANTSVSPYMNQYTDEVISRTQADIGRQQEVAQNKLGAQASAAGAFGGSRQGVAEGVMAGEYAKLAADTAAQQRQTGFTQAQQAAQADIANRLQADLANQGAGLTAQQSTAANTLQQQLANQGALNQAGQFGAQQGLRRVCRPSWQIKA
jgi:hypothetical protein